MKTVSGAMVSKKAVSLSKAGRILSKFAFTDNGASPAFAAYLKRASTSFDELVQFHKEIKGPGSEHKDRKRHHSSSGGVNDKTLNSVNRRSKDNDFLTQEKQFSSGLKKHVDGDNLVANNIVNSNNILKHDKKKKTDKGKEKNIVDASNRKASEIGGLDVAKETKVKKKRDKVEKSNSDLKIASEDPANQEASKVQETDGSEERKHKKKNRMEHEEEESASNVGSKQKDQTGGNGDVDGHGSAKKQVDGESGERKKQEKKQNKEGERKGDDDISRKRKHTRDVIHGGLDNSEELHQSKKKKK